jgi:hypothetical protein
MVLPLAFCLACHGVKFRDSLEQRIERIGHQLLR